MVLRLRASPFRTSCRPYGTSQANTNKIGQDSRWPGWQVVIGIETHAQIKSRKKLFSRGSEWQRTTQTQADAHIASSLCRQRHGHPTLEANQIHMCLPMMLLFREHSP